METHVDNDVIIKMAQLSLVAEFDRLLRSNGCTRPYFCVPAAYGSLRVSDKMPLHTKFYRDDAARKDALALWRMCDPLPHTDDPARLALIASVPMIDDGEAQLIDHACAAPGSLILTGDKRCMLTLATSPSLAHINAMLQGRFVHFEMLLESLASMSSFATVRDRVTANVHADGRLADALDARHSEKTARENLGRRIQSLQGDCCGLLRDRF